MRGQPAATGMSETAEGMSAEGFVDPIIGWMVVFPKDGSLATRTDAEHHGAAIYSSRSSQRCHDASGVLNDETTASGMPSAARPACRLPA